MSAKVLIDALKLGRLTIPIKSEGMLIDHKHPGSGCALGAIGIGLGIPTANISYASIAKTLFNLGYEDGTGLSADIFSTNDDAISDGLDPDIEVIKFLSIRFPEKTEK